MADFLNQGNNRLDGFLEGENILLRALEPSDLDFLYAIENDPNVWEVSHTVQPFSKAVLKRYIESASDIYESKQLRLVIQFKGVENSINNDGLLGLIDVFDFDIFNGRAGIGVFIQEGERGKGFAKESLFLLLTYLKNHLGLKQVYCNINSTNEKSIHLFESCGFNQCGEKKQWNRIGNNWNDELMFQLLFK